MFSLKADRTAVVCHAEEDTGFARDLGKCLELNCRVSVSYETAAPDLLAAVERATSADLVFVMLSPPSVPSVWKRDQWEPVLFDTPREFGTEMAYVPVAPCKFPELLRRKNFFDCGKDRLAGLRTIKRWLIGSTGEATVLPDFPIVVLDPAILERLRQSLGDQPGMEDSVATDAALAFAHASVRDFEGVFWIHCGQRSRCGVLGDTGHALGLRLPGTQEQNREALREFCSSRRCLLVFADLDPTNRELMNLGGKASVIFTSDLERPRRSPEEITRLFASWPNAVEECVGALGEAQSCLWETRGTAEFGPPMAAVLRHLDRFAEAYEVLHMLAESARRSGDVFRAHQIEWEQSWIADRWGHPVELSVPARVADAQQLSLF